MVHADCARVLFDREQLQQRVRELAEQVSKLYQNKKPIVVCVLKGSVLFFADLVRELSCECELDFISASSYGSGAVSSGELIVSKDISLDVKGREVLLVEDIIDSGNTLYRLKCELEKRAPASVKIVALLDKPARRASPVKADFVGFEIEDEFVVGYGLDYAERYRNLPYVGVLKRNVYQG